MRTFLEQCIKDQHDRRPSILAEGKRETKGVCSLWEDERQENLLKTAASWGQVSRSKPHSAHQGKFETTAWETRPPRPPAKAGGPGGGARGSPTGRAVTQEAGSLRDAAAWPQPPALGPEQGRHYYRLNPCPALAPGPEGICGLVPSSAQRVPVPPLVPVAIGVMTPFQGRPRA